MSPSSVLAGGRRPDPDSPGCRTLGQLFDEQRLSPRMDRGPQRSPAPYSPRSFEPGRFVGTSVTPRMARRSAATDEDWFANLSAEGTPIYTAFSRIRSTGWTMVLRAPAAVVDALGAASCGSS